MFFEIRKFPIFRKFAVFFDKNSFFFLKTLDMYIFSYFPVNGPSKMNAHQAKVGGHGRKPTSFVLNWTTMGQCRYYLPDSMKVNDLGRLNVDGLGYAN